MSSWNEGPMTEAGARMKSSMYCNECSANVLRALGCRSSTVRRWTEKLFYVVLRGTGRDKWSERAGTCRGSAR